MSPKVSNRSRFATPRIAPKGVGDAEGVGTAVELGGIRGIGDGVGVGLRGRVDDGAADGAADSTADVPDDVALDPVPAGVVQPTTRPAASAQALRVRHTADPSDRMLSSSTWQTDDAVRNALSANETLCDSKCNDSQIDIDRGSALAVRPTTAASFPRHM